MKNKLKTNFRLASVLVRIFFVLAFVFCNWQAGFAASQLALGRVDMLIAFLSVALCGVLFMFLLPVVVRFAIVRMRFVQVPIAEYSLLALLFFAIGMFGCGALNLVNIFTPLALTWGGIVFPYVCAVACGIGFYKVTATLYFNSVTKVTYFKYYAIVFLACLLVFGVVL